MRLCLFQMGTQDLQDTRIWYSILNHILFDQSNPDYVRYKNGPALIISNFYRLAQ